MINQDYILLIMNCKKYANKAQYQRTTWLKNIPTYLQFYHVIGDPDLEQEFVFNNDAHILFIKVDDDYNSLPKKVIRAYNAVNNTFNFNYIFKTDDDQILTNNKFFDIVKGLTSKLDIHYGGHIVDVKHNHLSQYHKIHPELPPFLPILQTKYCSGRFYFLSKQATHCIISKKNDVEKEYFEDYAIGFYLDLSYKQNMIHLATNKFFIDMEEK